MRLASVRRLVGVVSVIAIALLAFLELRLNGSGQPFDARPLTFVRLMLLPVTVFGAVASVDALILHSADRSMARWWEGVGPRDGQIEWCEVYGLVSANPELDPLAVSPRLRTRSRWLERVWLLIVGACACVLASQMTVFLYDPTPPAWLRPDGKDGAFVGVVSISSNLTAYLALLASAVAIVFTYHQLRAKVRADSRQQWIEKARSLVAETLALRTRRHGGWLRSARDRERLDHVRLELELMLNPSERDHRLLMYLVQRLSILDMDGRDAIQDAVAVRREIFRDGPLDARPCGVSYRRADNDETHPCLGRTWNEIVYADQEADLLSYIMRLSHAVLKREWQRVKHTR